MSILPSIGDDLLFLDQLRASELFLTPLLTVASPSGVPRLDYIRRT